MLTEQGDLALLADPVARQLLHGQAWAHLAYTWPDGTPRVVPIGFHWDGREIVLATAPDTPKLRALADGVPVALTVDGDRYPDKVLLIRGEVRLDEVDGVVPEYAAMCRRMLGEEAGRAWVAQMAAMFPRMVRLAIRPTWVGVQDFETCFPHFLERGMARAQHSA